MYLKGYARPRIVTMRFQGFTLIELMLSIFLVALLIGFAVPAYQNEAKKSRREDGKAELARLIHYQDRYFINAMAYAGTLDLLGFPKTGHTSEEGHYAMSIVPCGTEPLERCVQINATPIGGHSGDGVLSINSRGEKDWTGNAAGETGWP